MKEYAVSQFPRGPRMGYSLRTEKYRYTVWVNWKDKVLDTNKVFAEELYDYDKDPLETSNVVDKKEYAQALETMKAHFEDFKTKYELNALPHIEKHQDMESLRKYLVLNVKGYEKGRKGSLRQLEESQKNYNVALAKKMAEISRNLEEKVKILNVPSLGFWNILKKSRISIIFL